MTWVGVLLGIAIIVLSWLAEGSMCTAVTEDFFDSQCFIDCMTAHSCSFRADFSQSNKPECSDNLFPAFLLVAEEIRAELSQALFPSFRGSPPDVVNIVVNLTDPLESGEEEAYVPASKNGTTRIFRVNTKNRNTQISLTVAQSSVGADFASPSRNKRAFGVLGGNGELLVLELQATNHCTSRCGSPVFALRSFPEPYGRVAEQAFFSAVLRDFVQEQVAKGLFVGAGIYIWYTAPEIADISSSPASALLNQETSGLIHPIDLVQCIPRDPKSVEFTDFFRVLGLNTTICPPPFAFVISDNTNNNININSSSGSGSTSAGTRSANSSSGSSSAALLLPSSLLGFRSVKRWEDILYASCNVPLDIMHYRSLMSLLTMALFIIFILVMGLVVFWLNYRHTATHHIVHTRIMKNVSTTLEENRVNWAQWGIEGQRYDAIFGALCIPDLTNPAWNREKLLTYFDWDRGIFQIFNAARGSEKILDVGPEEWLLELTCFVAGIVAMRQNHLSRVFPSLSDHRMLVLCAPSPLKLAEFVYQSWNIITHTSLLDFSDTSLSHRRGFQAAFVEAQVRSRLVTVFSDSSNMNSLEMVVNHFNFSLMQYFRNIRLNRLWRDETDSTFVRGMIPIIFWAFAVALFKSIARFLAPSTVHLADVRDKSHLYIWIYGAIPLILRVFIQILCKTLSRLIKSASRGPVSQDSALFRAQMRRGLTRYFELPVWMVSLLLFALTLGLWVARIAIVNPITLGATVLLVLSFVYTINKVLNTTSLRAQIVFDVLSQNEFMSKNFELPWPPVELVNIPRGLWRSDRELVWMFPPDIDVETVLRSHPLESLVASSPHAIADEKFLISRPPLLRVDVANTAVKRPGLYEFTVDLSLAASQTRYNSLIWGWTDNNRVVAFVLNRGRAYYGSWNIHSMHESAPDTLAARHEKILNGVQEQRQDPNLSRFEREFIAMQPLPRLRIRNHAPAKIRFCIEVFLDRPAEVRLLIPHAMIPDWRGSNDLRDNIHGDQSHSKRSRSSQKAKAHHHLDPNDIAQRQQQQRQSQGDTDDSNDISPRVPPLDTNDGDDDGDGDDDSDVSLFPSPVRRVQSKTSPMLTGRIEASEAVRQQQSSMMPEDMADYFLCDRMSFSSISKDYFPISMWLAHQRRKKAQTPNQSADIERGVPLSTPDLGLARDASFVGDPSSMLHQRSAGSAASLGTFKSRSHSISVIPSLAKLGGPSTSSAFSSSAAEMPSSSTAASARHTAASATGTLERGGGGGPSILLPATEMPPFFTIDLTKLNIVVLVADGDDDPSKYGEHNRAAAAAAASADERRRSAVDLNKNQKRAKEVRSILDDPPPLVPAARVGAVTSADLVDRGQYLHIPHSSSEQTLSWSSDNGLKNSHLKNKSFNARKISGSADEDGIATAAAGAAATGVAGVAAGRPQRSVTISDIGGAAGLAGAAHGRAPIKMLLPPARTLSMKTVLDVMNSMYQTHPMALVISVLEIGYLIYFVLLLYAIQRMYSDGSTDIQRILFPIFASFLGAVFHRYSVQRLFTSTAIRDAAQHIMRSRVAQGQGQVAQHLCSTATYTTPQTRYFRFLVVVVIVLMAVFIVTLLPFVVVQTNWFPAIMIERLTRWYYFVIST